jgi:hypothetical protein
MNVDGFPRCPFIGEKEEPEPILFENIWHRSDSAEDIPDVQPKARIRNGASGRLRALPVATGWRITYQCSRSCERSEQFARVPVRSAPSYFLSRRASARGSTAGDSRGAEWLHGVMRSLLRFSLASRSTHTQRCEIGRLHKRPRL